ncbi:MAG: hypothetical protein L0027_05740 [Candidatus Rokubacteria bacterium]|nr:hypothetical protein [Candidatus Rokubacteria bacterium]
MARRWAVGIDVGGTWARGLALDARGGRRTRTRPAIRAVPGIVRRTLASLRLRPREVAVLVVAARGIWTPAERRRAARAMRSLASRVRVISDVEAAHAGALADRAGVLLLAGTGAIVLGRDARGRWRRAGGLGPLVGDDGSAFWIGREWLRAQAAAGALALARRLALGPDAVARIAALAPAVLRRARGGDPEARRVVGLAQAALAAMVARVARDLRLPAPFAVSWAGGLMADQHFRAGVWRAARRAGLRLRVEAPRESAVRAAARLATRLRDGAGSGAGHDQRAVTGGRRCQRR